MAAAFGNLIRAASRKVRKIFRPGDGSGANPSYSRRSEREIEHFKDVEVVHDLPEIFHYWSNKYVRPILEQFGFSNPNEFFLLYLKKVCRAHPRRRCRLVSLGAGNAETELLLVRDLISSGVDNFSMECLDLDPYMLERGASAVSSEGLRDFFVFTEWDVNKGLPEESTTS